MRRLLSLLQRASFFFYFSLSLSVCIILKLSKTFYGFFYYILNIAVIFDVRVRDAFIFVMRLDIPVSVVPVYGLEKWDFIPTWVSGFSF